MTPNQYPQRENSALLNPNVCSKQLYILQTSFVKEVV